MKLSPKQKKWGKRLLIFLAIRVVLGGILFYIIDYRFKDIIQIALKEKSNDKYVFDCRDIDVSIFKKNLFIRDAVISRRDTVNTDVHYTFKIKTLHFKIKSFSDLIFHQRVSVDSLSVISPIFAAHEHKKRIEKINFQPDKIDVIIHNILKHLRVGAFSIVNANYKFSSKLGGHLMDIGKVNLTIRNFSDSLKMEQNLFSSEDIELVVGKQQIILPDGRHVLAFNRFYFSGKKKYAEIDSFKVQENEHNGKTIHRLIADKVRFKASSLPMLFQKDELIVDSIFFINPVVQLGHIRHKNTPVSQTKSLLKSLKFRYVKIDNGSVLHPIDSLNSTTYNSKKIDLSLYNLNYKPGKIKSLNVDSVKLALKKFIFIAKDGKSQLEADELGIYKDELLLKGAKFSPTHSNLNHNLTFYTPALSLSKINIADLIANKLSAYQATLKKPFISILNNSSNQVKGSSKKPLPKLFDALRSIKDLISVEEFKIDDGTLAMRSGKNLNSRLRIDHLDAKIFANNFLNSDTSIEIKHAIPQMSFKQLAYHSPKLTLKLKDYEFKGKVRHNNASSALLKMKNGTSVEASKLFWEWLDWDILQNEKKIIYRFVKHWIVKSKYTKSAS
ncbi:AsmA family protein [Pedobacter jamesrossensis]|uniref:DUF748 domain-containing protein n=1 Tax=Pedobacter jamesrossensis TaxID=1908238 RepID=A0ABV8NNJ0_9SPHI